MALPIKWPGDVQPRHKTIAAKHFRLIIVRMQQNKRDDETSHQTRVTPREIDALVDKLRTAGGYIGNRESTTKLFKSYQDAREMHFRRLGVGCAIRGRLCHTRRRRQREASKRKRSEDSVSHVARDIPAIVPSATPAAGGSLGAHMARDQGAPVAPHRTMTTHAPAIRQPTTLATAGLDTTPTTAEAASHDCPRCGAGFTTSRALGGHSVSCSSGLSSVAAGLAKPCKHMKCPVSTFASVAKKKAHEALCPCRPRVEKPVVAPCRTCGWICQNQGARKSHQRSCDLTEHSMRKAGLVKCSVCWKIFNGNKTGGPTKAPNKCVFRASGLARHQLSKHRCSTILRCNHQE